MSRNWTSDQKNAIEARGGGLLVSAAAGSGKTAVLVERVIRRVLEDRPPVDIDRLLVVTFSKASAAEMCRRIGESIRARLQQTPDDPHLLRQQMLLDNAHISTIHSFCYELVRQNFTELGISHDVRLADEQETALLRGSALQKVLAHRYAEDDGRGFLELVEMISSTRNDRAVEKTVEKLYHFVRSHPFYHRWMEEKLALYSTKEPLENTPFGHIIMDYAREGLEFHRMKMQRCIDSMDQEMQAAYLQVFTNELRQLEELIGLAAGGSWDQLCHALQNSGFVRLPSLRSYADQRKKDYVTYCRSEMKDFVNELKEKRFCAGSEENAADLAYLQPRVAALFDTVLEFDQTYAEAKNQRHILDFSDLEHMALRLLVREEEDGSLRRTELARSLAEQFEEILVDEYQDTNAVQEMIFTTLSKQEENLFCVGDVKQSIYRFRLAMPELFMHRRQKSVLYDGQNYPACVVLGKNFRSREKVIDSVNFFFRMLMSRQVGEVTYDQTEELVCGADYPEDTHDLCRTELHVIDCSEGEYTPKTAEPEYVAAYVRRLLDSRMPVGRADDRHEIQPQDICLLLRSTKNRVGDYAAALGKYKIPTWTNLDSGFLKREEVSAVLALLRAVDDPLLDMPMVEAMTSPIFGMSSDDMARIRLFRPNGPFYYAVQKAAEAGDQNCLHFLEVLEKLRRHAAWESADRVILRLYEETGFLRVARVMPEGKLRRNNLRLLADYAREYGSRGYSGISGFLNLTSRLLEQEKDLAPAAAPSAGAVTICSIHSSKGLEYPVVLLCDLEHQFNRTDLNSSTQVHSELGFVCKRRDTEKLIQYTTVPLEAVRLEAEREMLSEEMRILYVALTRACEKLVLFAALNDPVRTLSRLTGPLVNNALPSLVVRGGKSYFDWIATALIFHPAGRELAALGGAYCEELARDDNCFRVIFAKAGDQPKVEDGEAAFGFAPADQALLRRFEENCSFVYPHAASVVTPSKFSVSQLSHQEGRTCSAPPGPPSSAKKT
ncbi:MAG: helicase-exonuclease AddAB subunit AddA [Oscillospiraceae bacterium]|nr:helicase-exonuclease AddAB subunit AddA [Oscillospiraceae bacterium]